MPLTQGLPAVQPNFPSLSSPHTPSPQIYSQWMRKTPLGCVRLLLGKTLLGKILPKSHKNLQSVQILPEISTDAGAGMGCADGRIV